MTLRRHDASAAPFDSAGDIADVFRDPVSGEYRQETMVINMGPQHPSTHGVLRLLLELDGESVLRCEPVIGYLHTGIEKNTEYRTWVQGVTFVTRADYVAPFFNELAYCMAVERLLGIEVPERAQLIRVLVCELNRITSHLVGLATTGLEMGAVSVMLYGLREREMILDIFEAITGLRMNHAYIRPGGVVMDLHEDAPRTIRDVLDVMPRRIDEYETLLNDNPIWRERNQGVAMLVGRALSRARRDRAAASGGRRGDRPAQGHAVLRVRDVRLRRADADRGRRVRALPGPDRRDAGVAEDRRAGARSARADARPGDGRRTPRSAGSAKLSVGPDGIGNDPAYLAPHHGGVDGGADPSLQDGDAGRRRARRRGVQRRRGAARRARRRTSCPTVATGPTACTSATPRS